ncbi:MAG: bifunctional aldolase/short-chain dehydrogenase [Solirubrobacteraceae bacterium]
MSTTTRLIAEPPDRWPERDVPEDALGQLVVASRLLGCDRRVANMGGGNTSAKGTTTDHAGREARVLWVKGSGSDLATMEPADFTVLRLDEVEPLFQRAELSDEEMVAYLGRCMLDPSMPRSSIETLLHAFIPAPHVHHTHPDAINVLASSRNGERLVRECFGTAAAWIPYIRPGFTLAKQVGQAVRGDPALRLVVLARHGLVCWGETAEEAYRTTIEVIDQAAQFVNEQTAGEDRFDGPAPRGAEIDDPRRRSLLHDVLPAVRGAVSSASPKVLTMDLSPAAVEFVSSCEAERLVRVGAACPDHLVHTKRIPLWIPFDPSTEGPDELRERTRTGAQCYREEYQEYFDRNADRSTDAADPDARVILVQHLGLVAAGTTVKKALTSRDLYHRAIEVMAGAHALDEFVSLDEKESFAVEYWPLELYKLAQAPPPGELQGQVALVTGAAGGIGGRVVERLAEAGAAVVGFDLDQPGAEAAIEALGEAGLAAAGDVTDEDDVHQAFELAVEHFGGVDIVVSNAGIASSAAVEDTTLQDWQRNQSILGTGYFLVAREAFKLLRSQQRGGSIVFVASKNALAAGKNASAYSSAKALELHLARCLAEEGGTAGIRVNTVNPDAVLEGSKIWGSRWREERASSYGIEPDELERHYRDRAVLGVNVLPEDVAEAVLHFASPARSAKSTGNILNVDGGNTTAYPR